MIKPLRLQIRHKEILHLDRRRPSGRDALRLAMPHFRYCRDWLFCYLFPEWVCAPTSLVTAIPMILVATLLKACARLPLLLRHNILAPVMASIVDSHNGLIHREEEQQFLHAGRPLAASFFRTNQTRVAIVTADCEGLRNLRDKVLIQ